MGPSQKNGCKDANASADKPNSCLSISHRRSTTVSFETVPIPLSLLYMVTTTDLVRIYQIQIRSDSGKP